jgi:replication initiation protein RepC
MQQLSLTPFGRQPVTAGLLAAQARATAPAPLPHVDKWTLFNDLRTARARFGLSDRELGVLYALLTFHPGRSLDDGAGLIVFPSNAALADRAHGMSESTLRRHLGALVRAGLILRHDSPNGKRYAARDRSGQITRAFGFDLRPLLVRAEEIAAAAEAEAQATETLRRAREAVVLALRDATKLADYGRTEGLPGDWQGITLRLAEIRRALRRRMDLRDVADLDRALGDIMADLRGYVAGESVLESEDLHGNDSETERHLTNSKPDSIDLEPCPEKGKGQRGDDPEPTVQDDPPIPLVLVLKACPDIEPYARDPITTWRDLIATAAQVRGMMGISASAWAEAQQDMGPAVAAVVVAAMLQRMDAIRNPGGYLRALSAKAAAGSFSPGPMIMALLNTEGARAA